jgi:hypothetical protein
MRPDPKESESPMALDRSALQERSVCGAGGSPEPVVSPELLSAAVGDDAEPYRALLPVGYQAGVIAYRQAVSGLTVHDLSHHYTDGLTFFHQQLVPHLTRVLFELTGGAWDLKDFRACAAGSDVDFMTHLVSAVAGEGPVMLYPGDWFGFRVGVVQARNIVWDAAGGGALACLCVPSVRNGHVTPDMLRFLHASPALLLNINLLPTLAPEERHRLARELRPLLERAILSVSFSRGFGLTGSQLGVALMHRDHPLLAAYHPQWSWLTYFFNGIAARAFMNLDIEALARIDGARRRWVADWLRTCGLPAVESGSYYVKSFRLSGPVPSHLDVLRRDGLVRLCLKPPIN